MQINSGAHCRTIKRFSAALSLCFTLTLCAVPSLAARSTHTHHSASSKHSTSAHAARLAKLHKEHLIRFARTQAKHNAHQAHVNTHKTKIAKQNHALHSGNVVAAARSFEGTRYIFGGTSRSGFDCSGFTRYILGESAGVELPRTALEQYYNGEKIATADLKPGDLVFFKNTYRHGISHVGIYIGNNKFVHACNESRGVTVDSLSTPYYVNHYAGARRVIFDRTANER